MIPRIGWRNLWRNKRRTFLTMTAMAAATALVIVNLGIYDGMLWDMIEGATEMYHGHARVTSPDYLERAQLHRSVAADALPAGLRADPAVEGVAPRVHGFALLSFGRGQTAETQPGELLAIDPAAESSVTLLAGRVEQGRFLEGAAGDGIVLGAGLAERLGAELGGELAAMGQAADGSIAQGLFTVVGIIDTGDSARDAMLAIVGLEAGQAFFALEGRVHAWALKLGRPLAAAEWAAETAAALDGVGVAGAEAPTRGSGAAASGGGALVIQPWQRIIPVLAQYVDIWVVMELVVAAVFYFAVVLVTMNTMTMAFFERIREFAVMGALGLRPWKLSGLIMYEAILMTALAGVAGGMLGAAGSFALYEYPIDLSGVVGSVSMGGATMPPRLRSYPTAFNLLMPVGLMLVLGVLVAVLPALRLRRLRPVDALREV